MLSFGLAWYMRLELGNKAYIWLCFAWFQMLPSKQFGILWAQSELMPILYESARRVGILLLQGGACGQEKAACSHSVISGIFKPSGVPQPSTLQNLQRYQQSRHNAHGRS